MHIKHRNMDSFEISHTFDGSDLDFVVEDESRIDREKELAELILYLDDKDRAIEHLSGNIPSAAVQHYVDVINWFGDVDNYWDLFLKNRELKAALLPEQLIEKELLDGILETVIDKEGVNNREMQRLNIGSTYFKVATLFSSYENQRSKLLKFIANYLIMGHPFYDKDGFPLLIEVCSKAFNNMEKKYIYLMLNLMHHDELMTEKATKLTNLLLLNGFGEKLKVPEIRQVQINKLVADVRNERGVEGIV